MRGFFKSGELQRLHQQVQQQAKNNTQSFYFIDEDVLAPVQEVGASSRPDGTFGGNTYLSHALDQVLNKPSPPDVVWFITDNQPSVGNKTASDQDLDKFYDGLRSEQIKRIYFFPLQLRYQGPLFRADDSVLTDDYNGQRGLMLYALLLNDRALPDFERAVTDFQRSSEQTSRSTKAILLKPLERDTIMAEIEPLKDGKLIYKNNNLEGSEFYEGQPIVGKFALKITSKLRGLTLNEAKIKVERYEEFVTNDFHESRLEAFIEPDTFTQFTPGKTENPFIVTLKVQPVTVKRSLTWWWHTLQKGRGDIIGKIQVVIKVESKAINVVEELVAKFSTGDDIYNNPDQKVQERIYGLDSLAQKMVSNQEQTIRPTVGGNRDGVTPVRLSVKYSSRPAWVFFSALLLLALSIFGIAWLIMRRPYYRLTWNYGQYRAYPDFRLWPFVGKGIDIDGQAVASIRKTPFSTSVSAKKSYAVGQKKSLLLMEQGTDFALSRTMDNASLNFRFALAKQRANSHRGSNRSPYGDAISNNSPMDDGKNGTPPPVQRPTFGNNSTVPGQAAGEIDLNSLFK